MEILLFVMDALVFAVMVCMSARDERRPAGRPPGNLFRMRAPPPAAAADQAPARPGRRR